MKINCGQHYLWRAVDHEGEVLESFVTKRRDKKARLTIQCNEVARLISKDGIAKKQSCSRS